jgi:hypothetical protein
MLSERLTIDEGRRAVETGGERNLRSVYRGSEARGIEDDNELWAGHIEGAGAECAVGKALGIPWQAGVDEFGEPDVGPYHVRQTPKRHGYLIIRPKDNDDEIFILATGRIPLFQIVGWLTPREARELVTPTSRNGRPPACFVEQGYLHPMSELPSEEEARSRLKSRDFPDKESEDGYTHALGREARHEEM